MVIRKLLVVLALSLMGPLFGCGAAESAAASSPGELGPELCSQRDLIPEAAKDLTLDHRSRLWFIALGKRCACWEGRLLCSDPDPPQCFWNGRWYGEGEQAWLLRWCSCEAAEWNCSGRRDVAGRSALTTVSVRVWDSFIFKPDDTAVLDEEHSNLSLLAGWLGETPNRGLALAGLVDLSDGTQAIDLANRRAESVRKALIERGVPEDRFLVLPAELDPVQGHRLRRVRFERIPKPIER